MYAALTANVIERPDKLTDLSERSFIGVIGFGSAMLSQVDPSSVHVGTFVSGLGLAGFGLFVGYDAGTSASE